MSQPPSQDSQFWTSGLNEEQARAVAHNHGPLLILAGAGSGKTTVLVSRAGRLIADGVVAPDGLLVLTFTNKAARELKSRVQKKLGAKAKKIWAGTFHSFGLSLLREHHEAAGLPARFGILDQTDAVHIAKEILKEFHQGDKTAYDGERLLSILGRMRENGQTEAKKDDEYEVAAEWLLPKYLRRLDSLGMVDFDGLILRSLHLMEQNESVRLAVQNKFQQVMVDEFQDTNQMQMRLIRKLAEGHRNLAVVGDDDQSIYGWRGACVSNILDFPKFYSGCQVVRLETNYRSTPPILNLANFVISKNTERHAKTLRPHPGAGSGLLPEVYSFETEDEEAESISNEIQKRLKDNTHPNDIAVIYRSNSQGAMLEAELRKSGIAYRISGGTAFFDRKETRDVLAYLRCALHPNEIALRRILNTPPRGIGEKTVETLTEFSRAQSVPFIATVRRHAEAGLEAKASEAVAQFLVTLETLIPTLLTEGDSAGAALVNYFTQIGYRQYLEKFSGNALVATKRWRLIEIFGDILNRFVQQGGRKTETLREFVDAMELRDVLENAQEEKDAIQLLTLHACKGLEWPYVYLAGVEEDILPHRRLGSDIAEERRLFYVGITRAREHLILTRAKKRRKNGKMADSPPSRFLVEVPPELIQAHDGPKPISDERRKSLVADLFKKLDQLSQT